MRKVVVIGGSVSGSRIAGLLAKRGFQVDVIEEHPEIGKPFACTGILTSPVEGLMHIPEKLILNRIRDYRIFAPNGEHVDIRLERPDLVLDRIGLDRHMASEAQRSGAIYHLGARFIGFGHHGVLVESGGKQALLEADIIIGADGPHSPVAHAAGIFGRRKFMVGLQVTVNLRMENLIETCLFKRGFGWVVPISATTARIGIIGDDEPAGHFNKLLRERLGDNYEHKVIQRQAGIEPYYNPNIISQKGNVYLIGDSATQVKATTAGGIMQCLLAADALCEAIVSGRNYDQLWKKRFGRELLVALLIRRALNAFGEADYNGLVRLFRNERLAKILSSFSRDFPSRLALPLLRAEPRLLSYARFLPALLND